MEVVNKEQKSTAATQPVKVDIGSVESELANIWRAAIGGCIPQTAAPATRAILSNLLIYAATHEEARTAKNIATEAMGDHPARTIITDGEDVEPERHADVAMLCNITERGRRLCGEEIELHSHGATAAAVSMILPLLVPELPVYLWTPGDLSWGDEMAQHLVHIADHWIFDSRRFTNRARRFESIIKYRAETHPQIAAHDLAWVSLSQWREAIARHFDLLPTRAYLDGLTSVIIKYRGNAGEPPAMEPLLMACWLMCRLGWRLSGVNLSDEYWTLTAVTNTNELQIQLVPSPETQSAIEEVDIEAEVDGKHAAFQSRYSGRADEVILQAEAPDLPQMRHTIKVSPIEHRAALLHVLNTPGADRPYEQTIVALQNLVAQADNCTRPGS